MAKNHQQDPRKRPDPASASNADPEYRPYTLWFETLPSGDTAQVYLSPHPDSVDVISHWNGQVFRCEACTSLVEAERLAWEWWGELPNLMDIGPSDLADVSMPWA